MKPTAPKSPLPFANFEDKGDADELAYRVLDRAIARYEETRRIAEEARRLEAIDHSLGRWAELEEHPRIDAEIHLIRAILATDPGLSMYDVHRAERRRLPARGVSSNGTIYLAMPDDQSTEAESRPGGPNLMSLVVVEASRVVDHRSLLRADVA